MSAQSQQALKYLQRDDIGKVIAKGLSNLYTHRPQRPIKYLAQWLKSYSQNKQQMQKIHELQNKKNTNLQLFQHTKTLLKQKQQNQQHSNKKKNDKIEQFKKMIQHHQYQQELLQQILPQFVQKNTNITGAYIGQLNYPPRQITQEDTDDLAHFNTGADKVINYIGSSISHKLLMRGKILKLNQGVTAAVFNSSQPIKNQNKQQGQPQVNQKVKQNYIYVPNVVKNESIHYFKIPKLGAYLAVPLIYSSYLSQNIFDSGLKSKQQHLQNLQQFNRKKHDQLEQLNKNKQQLHKKIIEHKQKHLDQAQLQILTNQQNQLIKKIQQKTQQKFGEQQNNLPINQKSYVFCVDNLGKDEQLNQNDIKLIKNLIQHFKISWENKQKQLLLKDIQTQINYIKHLHSPSSVIKQQLQKNIQVSEDFMKTVNQIQDEKLQAYKIQEEQFNKLKHQLKTNKMYLQSFLKIKEFRVVKYKQVLQNILFFLRQAKKNVNIPKKAILNWKYVKSHYINEEVFKNILNYIFQGAKTEDYHFYSKTPFLMTIFQKFNEQEIFAYNIGLGALVKFIKKALKHRVSNVELRRAQKQVQKQQRDAVIAQNQIIKTEKIKALQAHRANLTPEQFQEFKQEQWSAKYDEQHLKHVPAQVIYDIDKDM